MKNKFNFKAVLSLLVMFLFTAVGFAKVNNTPTLPDYSGNWDFYFYDNADKVVGAKTLSISEDGSISVKANILLETVVYDTRISAIVSESGKVTEGEMMYMTKQEMVGTFTGNFNEAGGSGTWKNYMGKSGTWKATRTDKKTKD